MKMLELRNATASLAAYARHVRKEPVILTTHGKPVAALILITNADLETMMLSIHPKFRALIERSRARLKSERGVSGAELRRRLWLKPRTHHNGKNARKHA